MVRGGGTEADAAAGVAHARAAVVYGGDDAAALATASLPILHLAHDFEAASGAIARAISLNGSCATALYFGSHVHAWRGDVAKAEDYAFRALRLSPFDPLSYHAYLALGTVRMRQKLCRLGGVSRQGDASQSAVQHAVCIFGFGAGARRPRLLKRHRSLRRLLELEPGFKDPKPDRFRSRFCGIGDRRRMGGRHAQGGPAGIELRSRGRRSGPPRHTAFAHARADPLHPVACRLQPKPRGVGRRPLSRAIPLFIVVIWSRSNRSILPVRNASENGRSLRIAVVNCGAAFAPAIRPIETFLPAVRNARFTVETGQADWVLP